MTLEQLVYDVEARLGRLLWRPDPLAELEEEAGRVAKELQDRREALARCDAARIAIKRRLLDNQAAAALLPSQIEASVRTGQTPQAWRLALDLDRLRKSIVEDQAALPRQDQACWSLQFKVRQLERRLIELHKKLYLARR
jgi:hypothetical protein